MKGWGGVVSRPESQELPSVGTLMMDTARNKVGEFQAELRGRFLLRPVGGGYEWEVSPEFAREATDGEKLSARVGVANVRSRGYRR
nr:hypothetical protein [Streptomyces gossypiisoli]